MASLNVKISTMNISQHIEMFSVLELAGMIIINLGLIESYWRVIVVFVVLFEDSSCMNSI